jgi:putative aldouronate transport system permease protein
MYIAAITSIDQQMYEAATVDGAGRFQKIWHITIPELIPTYLVLLLLQIAGILNNGMEQYLVFENATNTSPITVLDLFVYKLGIDKGVIPLSTVIGMVKSLVSVSLLFGANAISKAVRGKSIT